jgi:1-acyl-sn-glycerol-3-phosphate acyltransferase
MFGSRLRRRLISVPAIFAAAVLMVVLCPVWIVVSALADLVRGRFRLPTTRLLAFGTGWAWLELIGVTTAFGLWLTHRSGDLAAHYRIKRWWAGSLMKTLELTTGIALEYENLDQVAPGRAVVLCRHASLADSLVSAYVFTGPANKHTRYVLKKELEADPCLDIVGHRLPNHFLDRTSSDATAELDALRALSGRNGGIGPDDVAVIFAEGTRSSPKKRDRALEKIGERDPERAARLAGLQHLIPPRPAGSRALLQGDPAADVVLAWHVGFDGLSNFDGILKHLAHKPRPVQFRMKRVPRAEVPVDDEAAFEGWLDTAWLQMDADVHRMLNSHP